MSERCLLSLRSTWNIKNLPNTGHKKQCSTEKSSAMKKWKLFFLSSNLYLKIVCFHRNRCLLWNGRKKGKGIKGKKKGDRQSTHITRTYLHPHKTHKSDAALKKFAFSSKSRHQQEFPCKVAQDLGLTYECECKGHLMQRKQT